MPEHSNQGCHRRTPWLKCLSVECTQNLRVKLITDKLVISDTISNNSIYQFLLLTDNLIKIRNYEVRFN